MTKIERSLVRVVFMKIRTVFGVGLISALVINAPVLAESGSQSNQPELGPPGGRGGEGPDPGFGDRFRPGPGGEFPGGGQGPGNAPGGWPAMGPPGGPEGFADPAERRKRIMERFDANHDGVLDDAEKAKMRELFEQRWQQRSQMMNQGGSGPGFAPGERPGFNPGGSGQPGGVDKLNGGPGVQ